MFNKTPTSLRLTLRALGRLIGYPDADLRAVLPQLADALAVEHALKPERLRELQALCQQLAAQDPMDAEARYV